MTYQPANEHDTGSVNPYRNGSHLKFLGEVHTGNDTSYHVIALWQAGDGTFAWAAETGTIIYANGHGEAAPFQTLTLDGLTSGTIDEFTNAAQAHTREGLARYGGPHGQTRLDNLLERTQQVSQASQQVASAPPRMIKSRPPAPQTAAHQMAPNAPNGYGYDMSKSQFLAS